MRRFVLRLDRTLSGCAWGIACALLALIAALGLWQVLARFIFAQPTAWTEEAMRRLLIWMVMLGVVVAFRRGALVSVDLMLRLSRGVWQRVVRRLVTGVTLVYLAVLVRYGVELVARVRFQTFASMELSISWAYAALPAGALLSIVAVIAHHLDPLNEELETAQ